MNKLENYTLCSKLIEISKLFVLLLDISIVSSEALISCGRCRLSEHLSCRVRATKGFRLSWGGFSPVTCATRTRETRVPQAQLRAQGWPVGSRRHSSVPRAGPSGCTLPSSFAAHVIAKAKGLAILSVIKAGFLVTARGGSGIVLARLPDGSKSVALKAGEREPPPASASAVSRDPGREAGFPAPRPRLGWAAPWVLSGSRPPGSSRSPGRCAPAFPCFLVLPWSRY